jgi:RNA binding exosome subunit
MTKQEAIQTIQTSFPSIWSREDVLQLINKIDEGTGFDTDNLIDKIKDAVENAINGMSNDEIVDTSDCEFEIHNGNEIQVNSVRVNTSDIVDNIMVDVVRAIEEYIEEKQEVEEV